MNTERIKFHSGESREITPNPEIGWGIDDVLLHAQTHDTRILELRGLIVAKILHEQISSREASLDVINESLLGQSLNETKSHAQDVLKPHATNGNDIKKLIFSGATTASNSIAVETSSLKGKGKIIDMEGAIEGRDTRSGTTKDKSVISTTAGIEMTLGSTDNQNGPKIFNLAEEPILELLNGEILYGKDIYHKSDAVLLLAITNPNSSIIHELTTSIQDHVVLPYNLDEEMQTVLMYLADRSEVDTVPVLANSPEIGKELTRKSYKYPQVQDALALDYENDPYTMQSNEWQLSQMASELGVESKLDNIPGYAIESNEYNDLRNQTWKTLMLHSTRYGFDRVWRKPDRGTDGGNQGEIMIGEIDDIIIDKINQLLANGEENEALELFASSTEHRDEIENTISQMWEDGKSSEEGNNWVIEAYTEFIKIPIEIPELGITYYMEANPSVHIVNGEVRNLMSIQLVDELESGEKPWGGNLIVNKETWSEIVKLIPESVVNGNGTDLEKTFDKITLAMKMFAQKVNSTPKYQNGYVRGGYDVSVAMLGGKFNDSIEIGFQDNNPRANGCETAYALYNHATENTGNTHAITRNVTPRSNFETLSTAIPTLIQTISEEHNVSINPENVKLIAVSSGWAQFGIMGDNPIDIIKHVLLIENQMHQAGLIDKI